MTCENDGCENDAVMGKDGYSYCPECLKEIEKVKCRKMLMYDRRLMRAQYQTAIDIFTAQLNQIDMRYGTYAKIWYDDERIRPVRVHGETTKPNGYSREIEIDEIILSGTGE